jgi:hypothetical protein
MCHKLFVRALFGYFAFFKNNYSVADGYIVGDFYKVFTGAYVCFYSYRGFYYSVYGKREEIAGYETECRDKLTEEGCAPENSRWYFRRFNWRNFFEVDIYGKRFLEYGYYYHIHIAA